MHRPRERRKTGERSGTAGQLIKTFHSGCDEDEGESVSTTTSITSIAIVNPPFLLPCQSGDWSRESSSHARLMHASPHGTISECKLFEAHHYYYLLRFQDL